METKVFAGGAVIAEQKSYPDTPSSNAVIWIHADPLTGSKQEVVKAGTAAGGIKAREEYEPLGQSVRPIAPIVLDPPGSSPTPITNAAGFPEWQCALPLQIIPSQCGLRILAKEEFVLGIWSESKKGNVLKIIDSPIPQFNKSSNERMSYALTSSAKKDTQNKRQEATAENVLAVVQSLPAIDALIESNSAEFGGDDKDVPLPSKEVIENRLKERTKSGSECAKAIENLINRLAKNTEVKAFSTKITDLFERVKGKNIKLDPSLKPLSGRADFTAVVFGSSRKIRIGPVVAEKTTDITLTQNAYISTLIHELVHHAASSGTYSDRRFAEAARELLTEAGIKPPDLPNANDVDANSSYAKTNYFNKYCPSPGGSK